MCEEGSDVRSDSIPFQDHKLPSSIQRVACLLEIQTYDVEVLYHTVLGVLCQQLELDDCCSRFAWNPWTASWNSMPFESLKVTIIDANMQIV